MIAYKGVTTELKSYNGYQYAVGVTFTETDIIIFQHGFHVCQDPVDCFNYYNCPDDLYYKVECTPVDTKNGVTVCSSIKLIEQVSVSDMLNYSYSTYPDKWSNTYRKFQTGTSCNYVDKDNNYAYNTARNNWPYLMQEPVNGFCVYTDYNSERHLWDIASQQNIELSSDIKYIKKYNDNYIILDYGNKYQLFNTETKSVTFGESMFFNIINQIEENAAMVLCDGNKYFIVDTSNPSIILLDNLQYGEHNTKDYSIVKKDGKYNIYNLKESALVYSEWVDDISNNMSDNFLITIGDNYNFMKFDGTGKIGEDMSDIDDLYYSDTYAKYYNYEVKFDQYY